MKRKQVNGGFIAFIVIVLLSASVGYSFYSNKFLVNELITKDNDTDIETTEIVTNKKLEYQQYQADYTYGNISFEYPETYPINTEMFTAFDHALIDIQKYNTDIDLSERNISSSEMKKYYRGLVNGDFVGKSPFSLWSNNKVQIKKTKSGKFFGVSTTYAAFDLCTIGFHTDISIPQNNNIIEITVFGDTDKILTSMQGSEMITPKKLNKYGVYEGGCFTEVGGMNTLSELLLNGQGTAETRDWYNAANHVIDSLEF
jgi:hypothetical protein